MMEAKEEEEGEETEEIENVIEVVVIIIHISINKRIISNNNRLSFSQPLVTLSPMANHLLL